MGMYFFAKKNLNLIWLIQFVLCKQRSCKINQDCGKYFSLNICCFFDAILHFFMVKLRFYYAFWLILVHFKCSVVTIVAFSSNLNNLECLHYTDVSVLGAVCITSLVFLVHITSV